MYMVSMSVLVPVIQYKEYKESGIGVGYVYRKSILYVGNRHVGIHHIVRIYIVCSICIEYVYIPA